MSESTVNVYPNQEISSKLPIDAEVVAFVFNEKPGSTLIGRAEVLVHGLFPDCPVRFRNIAAFRPFDPSDPDDRGRVKFAQCRQGDAWLSVIEFGDGKS